MAQKKKAVLAQALHIRIGELTNTISSIEAKPAERRPTDLYIHQLKFELRRYKADLVRLLNGV